MKTNSRLLHWLLFLALSFIWGSSFILMKEAMIALTASQVASLRIISSGIVLLPVTIRQFRNIPRNKRLPVFLSGVLGSLLPAYLFCWAEQVIDSSLAGTLNSLTPVFVIVIGALFFGIQTPVNKVVGTIIAFVGALLLFLSKPAMAGSDQIWYVLFVVLATICYGINVNLVHRHLSKLSPLHVVSVALSLCAIPATVYFLCSGFTVQSFAVKGMGMAIFYSCVLGVAGTALASVLFYKLINSAGTVFASMVTYGIPFVAMMWGIIFREDVGWSQAGALVVILVGVWIANRRRN